MVCGDNKEQYLAKYLAAVSGSTNTRINKTAFY